MEEKPGPWVTKPTAEFWKLSFSVFLCLFLSVSSLIHANTINNLSHCGSRIQLIFFRFLKFLFI